MPNPTQLRRGNHNIRPISFSLRDMPSRHQPGAVQGRGLKGTIPTPCPPCSAAQTSDYLPLGKWVVHYPKLTRGRLELRTHTGGRVGKYNKEKELSPGLARLLRRMLREPGLRVDTSEFQDLGPEDQEFMARLLSDSCVQSRVALPEVEMSQDSQDLQRFEVLKGQIGAGNDSRELVAEFKGLLVRFVKKGWVGKAAAADVLAELVDAGY